MKRHISIFTFLLGAVFAVGSVTDLRADETVRAWFVSTRGTWNSSDTTHITPSQGSIDSGRRTPVTFTALPPAGHQVTSWLWNDNAQSTIRFESDMTVITGSDQYRKVSGDKKTCTVSYSGEGTRALGIRFDYMPLTVTFKPNGGSGTMSPITGKNYDSSFDLTANAYKKTGYSFNGWTNDLANSFVNKESVNGSAFWNDATGKFHADLYVRWKAKTYTVTFDGNGGSTPSSQSVTYDSTYGTLPSSTRTGYKFAGWWTAASGGTEVKTTTRVSTAANHTLYAHWTAKTYTLTFNANSGTTPSPSTKSVTYGSTYGTLATCSRTGYTFDGWYTAASGGSKIESTTTVGITANQTLYAHWTPVTYTITYTGNKAAHSNPSTYTIESETIVFAPPDEVAGFKFNGWSPASIPKGSIENKTVTASYLSIAYKPDVVSPKIYNGYSQTCAQPGTGVVAEGNQAKDVGTYTAKFTPISGYCWSDGTVEPYVAEWKIVNAEMENVTAYQTGSLTYTGEPQQPTVFTRADVKGSTPATWKYSTFAGGYAATLPSFTDAGKYTVYYEVTAPGHNPKTGSFDVVLNRAREAKVSLSKDQFTYTGREQGPDVTFTHCTEASGSVRKATEVDTYYVRATPDANYAWGDGGTETRDFAWRIVEGHYTATVSAGEGGRGGWTREYTTSNDPQALTVTLPTRTGYSISDWTPTGATGGTPTISGTTLTIPARTAGDFTMTPTWEPITYTIDFDGNGGKGEMEPKTLAYDEAYVVPGCGFDFTGATFQCWNVLSGDKAVTNFEAGVTVSNLTTVADAHLTFRAEWQTNSYEVVFLPNGAKGTMPNQKFKYGERKRLTELGFVRGDPALWSFEGWTNSAAGGPLYTNKQEVSNLTAQADGRVELTAVWSSTIGELSIAMGCDNLKWESESWEVCDSEGFDGPPCVWQRNGSYAGMYAHITTNGVLSFKYKLTAEYDTIRVIIGQFWEGNPVMPEPYQWKFTYQEGEGWQDAVCEIPALDWDSAYIRVYHQKLDESGIAYVDQMTWTPEGAHPEPTDADKATISSAAVSDGKFSLSFQSDGRFDYNLLTNANLLINSWGIMETQVGDGNILTFEPQIIEGQPQMFYRVDTIQKK